MCASMAAMGKEKDELEFVIADFVRRQWGHASDADVQTIDNAIITAEGAPFATWKKQSRTTIDSKRLQKDKPELAAEYSNTTWFRSLRFK